MTSRIRLVATPLLLNLVTDASTGAVAGLTQAILTRVILLIGIGILTGPFNTRRARVSTQMDHTADLLTRSVGSAKQTRLRSHLKRLGCREWALSSSIALGALAMRPAKSPTRPLTILLDEAV
jgi:hypothetical protein